MNTHRVDIANRQSNLPCERTAIRRVVANVLEEETELQSTDLSIAIVDEERTREVNKTFLGRTGTTDVIAFTYHRDETQLQGEVVVNADEALRQSETTGHDAASELMIYVVHGVLHLIGYEDCTPELRNRMNGRAVELLRNQGYELDSNTLVEEQ